MAQTVSIVCDGTKTLSKLCEQYGANIQIVLQLNEESKSDLILMNMRGINIPAGTMVNVPDTLSLHYDFGKIYSTAYKSQPSSSSYNEGALSSLARRSSGNKYDSNNLPRIRTIGNSHKAKLSSFTIFHRGQATSSFSLPAYPLELSDTNSPEFSSVSLLGRSVNYQIYNGSSRVVSFSLTLHEEMFSNLNDLHLVVAALDSACYPNYSGEDVLPPEILFTVGGGGGSSSGFKKIRGILESFSPNWKAPIIDDKMVVCEMSFSIRETTGPYSGSQVKAMKGIRGK